MEAYVEGDVEAFERLFRSLGPSIHAFFVRSMGRGTVAEDLLQTTFLKIHAARGRWRRGEAVRPWAFTIAARVRVDWLRRHGRAEAELDEEVASARDPREDPADAAATQERSARVREALDALPEPQRVLVHLHRFEGMSFAQIGGVLGISEGAARVRAFRAYAALRKLLAYLVEEER
ncbi:RNA polymerase sigma factor [Anaeromyxobacter paludicola]|uniref:RNA polymerase subunit sigma-24 n=1 Tax=Anaeromyxobacter paludicola TaxID=2918171 RepID=A0ABN6NDX0_9BACT|nr:RNA polymerase sigma factor [Anaeromyxobacter paludicola]BDG10787.1 RNA polymerase subunit sigma-24 [Anaeromyxobacter paludicola]